MKKYFIIIMALLLTSACGITHTQNFKVGYLRKFTSNCVKGAMDSGATKESAQGYCRCVTGRIAKRYSYYELKTLQELPDDLLDKAINHCNGK